MTTGVNLVVRAVELRVRPVQLRLPFRFGVSTLTACPQLFVRVEVDVPGHCSGHGVAAEMMVPKWFDKRADRSARWPSSRRCIHSSSPVPASTA